MRLDQPGRDHGEAPDTQPERPAQAQEDDGQKTPEPVPKQTYAELRQVVAEDRAQNPRSVFSKPSEGASADRSSADEPRPDQWADPESTSRRIDQLKLEGHGPQRHLEVSHRALEERLGTAAHDSNGDAIVNARTGQVKKQPGTQIDPMTGTSTDHETGGPHYCGPYATRFDDPADYCRADEMLRHRAVDSGKLTQTASISDLFPGTDAKDRFTGYYQDPAAPEDPDGKARFKTVDFSAGTVIAVYDLADDGDVRLRTMYPDPNPLTRTEK